MHNLIFKFTNIYASSVKGCSINIKADGLYGGARIHSIFKGSFAEELKSIDPLNGLTKSSIITAIDNSNGINPELLVPRAAFELLAISQVEQFRYPSLNCVELVHEELNNIAQSCLEDDSLQLEHYPKLKTVIGDVVSQLLQHRLPTTNENVEIFIDYQKAYINTSHPDFIKAQSMEITKKDLLGQPIELSFKLAINSNSSTDDDSVKHILMQEYLKSYMSIVSKEVHDTIPKCIMLFLVNFVIGQLHKELVEQICNKGNHEDLLCESLETTKRRKEIEIEISELEKADKIVKTISSNK